MPPKRMGKLAMDGCAKQQAKLEKGVGQMTGRTTIFICHVRPSRRKAIEAAAFEMLCLLTDLKAERRLGGPLAEKGSIYWIQVPTALADESSERFPRSGYTHAVDRLEPLDRIPNRKKGTLRWRKQYFKATRVYTGDSSLLRELAPDRRAFAIKGKDGRIRTVRGYRGDGSPSGRRGLPVCDARLLNNIVKPYGLKGALFLDPFAGGGGIALEAMADGALVFTADVDPVVSPGLKQIGAIHTIADARCLPYPDAEFHAIATEPPYLERLGPIAADALAELARVLVPGGRMAMLCADWQMSDLASKAKTLGLVKCLGLRINRKGTACGILAWQRES